MLTTSPTLEAAYAVLKVVCIAVGAMTAIRLAGGRPLTHAVASVAVPYFVSATQFLGLYLGVSSLSGTVWSRLVFFLLPIPSALLGGWLYMRRTQKK